MNNRFACLLVATTAFVFNISQSIASPPTIPPSGVINAHIVECNTVKGDLIVTSVNGKTSSSIATDSNVVNLSAPEGYDSISFSAGDCVSSFYALVLGGFERDVVVTASPGQIDFKSCYKQDCLVYNVEGGHVMGRLPSVPGLFVELIGNKGDRYAAEVQRGAYYFDTVDVGHYELRVLGNNWYRDVRALDVTNPNTMIVNMSTDELWGIGLPSH